MKSIILMGIKHCGKSTQAKLLSAELSLPFYDTDTLIEEFSGFSPRILYKEQGKDEFLRVEFEVCKKLVNNLKTNDLCAVIATGGGICTNEKAVNELKTIGTAVFLRSPEKIASDRIVREISFDKNGKLLNVPAYIADKNPKNIADVRAIFHNFYEERCILYQNCADLCVDMADAPKSVNTRRLLSAISAATTAT